MSYGKYRNPKPLGGGTGSFVPSSTLTSTGGKAAALKNMMRENQVPNGSRFAASTLGASSLRRPAGKYQLPQSGGGLALGGGGQAPPQRDMKGKDLFGFSAQGAGDEVQGEVEGGGGGFEFGGDGGG
eukprot:CAMPEP_0174917448 /NCGR_PEP_ID=MMETSP1355-20121228/2457_1 /TAXON_ID=464990 /ORGANISM="Hemiselmis tepida, Strain CCMP443" /LENGTH=126 /DNA_ID=CAMNT_0016162533 /DNA_START=43 /DNA_END=420 /DNA_ORIENTATION=+